MEEDQVDFLDVLQMGWKEDVYGQFFCAVDIAFEVGQELRKQFSLTGPPPLERGIVEQSCCLLTSFSGWWHDLNLSPLQQRFAPLGV